MYQKRIKLVKICLSTEVFYKKEISRHQHQFFPIYYNLVLYPSTITENDSPCTYLLIQNLVQNVTS